MGYDNKSYETAKDNVLQGLLDEIKKRDFESHLDREAIELRDAEIERLEAENNELRNDCMQFRAQVEELTREVDMYNNITLGEVVKERDELKTKIQSLESLGYEDIYVAIEKERDELRTEVERRGGYMDELAEEVDRLRMQVFEIEKYAFEVLELRAQVAAADVLANKIERAILTEGTVWQSDIEKYRNASKGDK